MVTQDFSKMFYRTTNCLTSDIIADFAPVSRVLGVDVSAGMGTVFTAMGTRFDMKYVASEAFMATDSYEADTRSIDDTPVAEVMRYVRSEIIKADAVPEACRKLTEKVMNGECVYGQYQEVTAGPETADVLFLISPAASDAAKTAQNFTAVAGKLQKTAFCTNQYKDCGYLQMQLGQWDAVNAQAGIIAEILDRFEEVVTDDSYLLDALLIQFPELSGKILFIDEFIAGNIELTGAGTGRIVLHESGIIQRLYPQRKINYRGLFPAASVLLPQRSGYDVSDSGLAGGLGLAEWENLLAISARRMDELAGQEHDLILTPCACEAAGLNCSEREPVMTLLDYTASL